MRWLHSEYVLKGLFLGLLLFVSLQVPNWASIGHVTLFLCLGLGLGLITAIGRHVRDLARFHGKVVAFLLFVLLENPLLIYSGVILGLFAAALFEQNPDLEEQNDRNFLYCTVGGAILGYGLGELRRIPAGWSRFGLALAVGVGMVLGVLWWLDEGQFAQSLEKQYMLGMLLLIGVPFFYFLVFTAVAEETEAEMAALCAVLGIALQLILQSVPKEGPTMKAAHFGLLIPLTIYIVYSLRIMPGLRIFKHSLRGFSFQELGKVREALLSFRRALQLDPTNELAQRGLWDLHRSIDPTLLTNEPETLNLLDLELCLSRVAKILVGAGTPTPERLKDVAKVLDLVETQSPELRPQTDYYRAVAALHAQDRDQAAGLLTRLLDPASWKLPSKPREDILFAAWQLVLLVHPVMKQRVGETQIPLPGRRVEAIQAVERELAANPADGNALSLRQSLYDSITITEYIAAATAGPLDYFDYHYCEQLGLALLDDSVRWERGVEYLRMAIHGQLLRAPSLYQKIIEACEKQNLPSKAKEYRLRSKDIGISVGLERFSAAEKEVFFAQVKKLAEESAALQDWDGAIAAFSVLTRSDKSGVETLRQLADMYEKKKDALNALRVNEKALVYNASDPDLLARKDRYYYSLEPAHLKEVWEEVKTYFDVDYCITKSRQLLDTRSTDPEILNWAIHLIELARVAKPKDLTAIVQEARCRLRRGEREQALHLLEDVREMKPSGSEESDWWYFTVKQLGKLYLEEYNRPDMAIPCFREYQNAPKAGADTMYDLGRAYEASGQSQQAAKCYEAVTGYPEHPLRWDAEEALRRVRPT